MTRRPISHRVPALSVRHLRSVLVAAAGALVLASCGTSGGDGPGAEPPGQPDGASDASTMPSEASSDAQDAASEASGGCVPACKADEVCSLGRCAPSCATGLATCTGATDGGAALVCADLQSDKGHCGDCATACAGPSTCSKGKCLVCSTTIGLPGPPRAMQGLSDQGGFRRVIPVDLDGDGKDDLVGVLAPNNPQGPSPPGSVFAAMNRGDGTFAPAVEVAKGDAVAVGDLDGDGRVDLAMTSTIQNLGGPAFRGVRVAFGLGGGAFAPAIDYPMAVGVHGTGGIAMADLDGDRKLDLAFVLGSGLSVLRSDGVGGFLPRVDYLAGSPAQHVRAKDMDGDGDTDLVVLLSSSTPGSGYAATLSVLSNDGTGTLGAPLEYAVSSAGSAPSRSLDLAELNGDGRPDVVVAGSEVTSVFLGASGGALAPKTDYPGAFTLLGDLDRDGRTDLVDVGRFMRNRGDGTFPTRVDYRMDAVGPGPAGLGDFDGDGRPELAVANNSSYFLGGGTRTANSGVTLLPGRGDGTFEVGLRYAVQGSPSKILVGDLDGDAKRDLVVVSYDGAVNTGPGSVSVLHNDGAGTFSRTGDYAVGRTSFSPTALAALGDLNGDRKPDVVVDNPVDGSVSILVNNGDGTFAPKVDYPIGTIGGIASSLLIRDVNGDGKGDLVLARRMANVVSILLNNGDGTFAAKVDYPASLQAGSVVVEDLNGDGRPELVVLTGTTVTVFLNVINGAFVRGDQLAVGPQAREVALGDVDGDGKKDLVVAGTDVGVLLGNGTGTFAPRVDYPGGDGALVLADLNGDGRNDVALVGPIVTVLLNAGAGALAPGVGYPGFGLGASGPVAVEDMNGDGRPDLVMGAVVLANTGAGAFGEPATYSGIGTDTSSLSFGGRGTWSEVADLNGDGRPDVVRVVVERVEVLLNRGPLCARP